MCPPPLMYLLTTVTQPGGRDIAVTAENVDELTPLPQLSFPLDTPQLPLEDVMVKLLAVPEKV